MERSTISADAMFNLNRRSGANDDYRRGVLAGAVSGLMVSGMTFDEALAMCKAHCSAESEGDFTMYISERAIPLTWHRRWFEQW